MTAPVPLPRPLAAMVEDRRWTRATGGESGGSVHRLTRRGRPASYLKYGRGRVADDIADEAARLRWLAPRLPVPAVRWFGTSADEAWLLTDAIAGRTGDELVEADPAALDRLVEPLARFLRSIHAIPPETCPFEAGHRLRMTQARANVAAGRVDAEDFDDDHRGWTPERLWEALVARAPATVETVVTHGDFSLGNVLFAGDEVVGCIDVGRAGLADRYQDLAILWQNLREFGGNAAERFLAAYGADAVDQDRLAFHRMLDEFF